MKRKKLLCFTLFIGFFSSFLRASEDYSKNFEALLEEYIQFRSKGRKAYSRANLVGMANSFDFEETKFIKKLADFTKEDNELFEVFKKIAQMAKNTKPSWNTEKIKGKELTTSRLPPFHYTNFLSDSNQLKLVYEHVIGEKLEEEEEEEKQLEKMRVAINKGIITDKITEFFTIIHRSFLEDPGLYLRVRAQPIFENKERRNSFRDTYQGSPAFFLEAPDLSKSKEISKEPSANSNKNSVDATRRRSLDFTGSDKFFNSSTNQWTQCPLSKRRRFSLSLDNTPTYSPSPTFHHYSFPLTSESQKPTDKLPAVEEDNSPPVKEFYQLQLSNQ